MGKDIFEKTAAFTKAAEYRATGLYPYFVEFTGTSGDAPVATLDGRRLLMFGSNNYLGLCGHADVTTAARDAIETYGAGCSGSRMLNGTRDLHVRLEQALAEFLGREAALVFGTGFQANLGTLSALIHRDDVILSDRNNHASLLDGLLLAPGRVIRFRHLDLADLEHGLEQVGPDNGALIVVDGVFSMEGEISDLAAITELAGHYGARVYVDEAHGLGVLGAHGRGASELLNVEDKVDIVMGTFSKSLGTIGGFVASTFSVIDYIRHHSRAFMYSASLAPPNAAAALKALEILRAEPERRAHLMTIAQAVRSALTAAGFQVIPGVTPIVPVVMPDEVSTCRLFWSLMEAGIYTNPILVPAVTKNLLRISCMATHTLDHVDQLVSAMQTFARANGLAAQAH